MGRYPARVGASRKVATAAMTIRSGPLGLPKRGHDLEIKSGQVISA
jgi:hypothetical protein